MECSLINFCSIGDIKITKNRKMTKRKATSEEIPTSIKGIRPYLVYFVPDDEGMEDHTIFSDLLDEAEEAPDEPDDEDDQEDQQEEDTEMIYSSGDDKAEEGFKEKDHAGDDPMGEEKEEGPDSKRRRVVNMIELIPNTAKDEGVCLACGSTEHSMSECQNQEDIKRVNNNAFVDILAKIKTQKQSFPKGRRSNQERKNKEKKAPTDDAPDRVMSLYPEEFPAFTICADYQAGHWTAMGKHTNELGPSSHDEVIMLQRDTSRNGRIR